MESRRVVNREQPARAPVAPSGDVPVIVRLVWSDGLEEWRPARAVRWTSTHVMVGWRAGREAASDQWVWLRAGDVMRSVSWLVPPGKQRPG
ncbi:hypothetical protein Q6348_10985 [Isoptericola sp. b441]|uniref:Uncharacterized protein n=1 Tax=Actinotalea lenta TaxID=3064654 RepID=A0ABT9D9Y1_9CELL|nr:MULTISPECIES: hypothetical protein [unclassified Isoptericola]MDO8107720.1 hypothetical protein [Isoptericola sp. b441]MDO8120609.1 hypothetical protein [Isoptericola sp. b490]